MWWRLKPPASRLFTQLFVQAQIRETSKLRVSDLCDWNPPVTGGSPHKGPVTRKRLPFDDVITMPKRHRYLKYWMCLNWWSKEPGHQLPWYWPSFFSTGIFVINGVNSLWPSDAIWRQRSGSTLAQVMACCLKASSHYLNQCWLIISRVQWLSCEDNFIRDTSTMNH